MAGLKAPAGFTFQFLLIQAVEEKHSLRYSAPSKATKQLFDLLLPRTADQIHRNETFSNPEENLFLKSDFRK